MAPLNIAHYLPDIRLEQGGVARAVLDWCTLFADRGHNVSLITKDPKDVPQDWNAKTIPFEKADDTIRQSNILHLHAPWLPGNRALAKIAMSHNVPYLVTIHGMLDDWSMSQRALKKKIYMTLLGRRFLNNAATIHCTAAGELTQAKKWFDNPKTIVLPNLMDLKPFENLPGRQAGLNLVPPQHRDKQKILFLSRLHEKKGVDILLRASASLRDQNKSFVLLIAGSGEPAYEQHLKNLTTELNLNDRVIFLGMLTGETKISIYQAADLFVLPTQQENFGLVLAESLAAGTPIITTRGTDIWPELQEAGGIIADRTPTAIAAAITNLLANPTDLKQRGATGRQWAFDHLSIGSLAKKYETLYTDLAKK